MIKHLRVENFKSIKNLDVDCGRFNIFIGRPNSGKSNILESLSMLSFTAYGEFGSAEIISGFVRVEKSIELFHRGVLDHPIVISINENPDTTLEVAYLKGAFRGTIGKKINVFNLANEFRLGNLTRADTFSFIKTYLFRPSNFFGTQEPGPLIPPYGSNLLTTVLASGEIREFVSHFLREFGLKLNPRQHELKIEVQKEIDEIVFSFPYTQVSDTVQGIIFYSVAMKSNSNAVLVFEDPGMRSFPFYNKYLGERIAFDSSNQYFVCTHNPYFLLSMISKAPKSEIKIFITYLEDDSTRLKELTEEEVSRLLDMEEDPFFNIDEYLGMK